MQQQNNLKQNERQKQLQEYNTLFQNNSINTLVPYFLDTFIKEYDIDEIKTLIEKHFSDHKLVQEIANALILKKQNEKLFAKYGTLDIINEKLSEMLYKKIELLHQLELDDVKYGTKNDMEYDIKYYKDED